MITTSFLDKIAQVLLENYSENLSDVVVVLPNKRAKIFLIEALKKQTSSTIFSPEIISIEDFVQEISGIRSVDAVELLFQFYEVYVGLTEKSNQQSFEVFANWAKTLLQDFNEIDRYLLNPDKVLKYLDDIKEIEHWSLDKENQTELIQKHLAFWKLLPHYYHSFYAYLLNKGIGYQGMIYREAVKKLSNFALELQNKPIFFAGFNALNKAEETIIQHLIKENNAFVYWDIDQTFLNDSSHDAGLFMRRFKAQWDHFKSNPFEWIASDFSTSKKIEIIGTPKSIGQAKIVGSIVEKELSANPNGSLNHVAVVLGEESLLIPVLYALPETVGALNVTMGYSTKNNPAQILIAKLFKMHVNAASRNASNYVYYYKDVVTILTHPLVEPYVNARDLVNTIHLNNYSFITHKRLFELYNNDNFFFDLLFKPWNQQTVTVLDTISTILQEIKKQLSNEIEEEKISKSFVYAVFKVINKLISYYSQYQHTDKLETLFSIYKQVIEVAEVSFEGEPLNGLQIMGVLESRVLDFDTVIITAMNEGKFPAGKSQNSFIPYDVKKELGLPTFKEKDAIYTYHFYHLLQRAKKVFLIYNTESEGIDAGEKSRFITQLEIEKQPNHILSHEIYSVAVPEITIEPVVIPKSEMILTRLREIAQKGFSPSALTSYVRNPIDFYFQKILNIREVEEVEENIALNTLGTIIHEALKDLYEPFVDKFLTLEDMKSCLTIMNDVVLKQFKLVYKEGEIKKGRNLLAFEVAKRNVSNFLKLEMDNIVKGDTIKILFLEQRFERIIEHPSLPFPIKIGGSVDRIEERNGNIRIIDYKTGKVDKGNVVLKTWKGLTEDIKNDKIIQILAYAYLFEAEAKGKPTEAGIISFKNLKSGFLPFTFKEDKDETTLIDRSILENYIEQIAILLNEILDKSLPFAAKI